MRIMTWNIQNSGTIDFFNPNIINIQNILDTIKIVKPNIIVIQEYQNHYHEIILRDGLEKWGYSYTFCKDDIDRTLRKRVLIASDKPFEEVDKPSGIFTYSRRNWNEIYIPVYKLKILGIDVPLAETTDIYGNKRDNKKEKRCFLKALEKKFIEYKNCVEPAIILGDFNLHS